MTTVREALENAHYNLKFNGAIGLVIGRDQLENVMDALDAGKDLDDELEEEI